MQSAEQTLLALYGSHVIPYPNGKEPIEGIPRLTHLRVIHEVSSSNPLSVWRESIEALQYYRQYRIDKHTREYRAQGKTVWSDANAAREAHHYPADDLHLHLQFPRAVFGMPIILHFPQDKPGTPDITIQPAEYERFASPLILKALACADGQYAALAVRLTTPGFDQLPLILKVKDRTILENLDTSLNDVTARALGINPNEDAISAFFNNYKKWFDIR